MSNLLLFPSAEPEHRPEPPDVAVRAEALNIRRSFIVEAPAGSGKTSLLICRYLKLLANESVAQPEQVLAITFTNAAAADLRSRILDELQKAEEELERKLPVALAAGRSADVSRLSIDLAHQVLARDHALGWHLMTQPQRLKVRTIDSVCAEIARSLPLLSGSGGSVIPAEDATALHHEAARRTLLLLGSADAGLSGALRDLLLHRDGNLENCEALLADMLAMRDQWGELVPLQPHELEDEWLDASLLPRLQQTLRSAIEAELARLEAVFPVDLLRDLASLANKLGHLPGLDGEHSRLACCAGTSEPPEASALHLDRWRALIHLLVTADCGWRRRFTGSNLGFEFDKRHPLRGELEGLVDQLRDRDDLLAAFRRVRELPDAEYPADQWRLTKSLFRVLNRALVELQLVFAKSGQCDYTEIELLARAALRGGTTELAYALGGELQHLLVDEMQDTSAGQYELLELLTASWDGHSQTVFLVGDPCQSIYLFRQARVERFLHALKTERVGEIPLTRLALTANFRSQRRLVEDFNRDFGMIFRAGSLGGGHELAYVAAEATRPAAGTKGARVWHANPQPRAAAKSGRDSDASVPAQARRDADSIAEIAKEWLARPLPSDRREPWRIAVVVRSRNHLAEIVPALRRHEVPFRAIEIERLHERQEVLDLTALTRALLHPADRVAWFAVLRAPWCGLPLADLHILAGADDASLRQHSVLRLMEERAHLLSAGSRRRLERVLQVLRTAMGVRSRMSTAQLVERAWHSLGGDVPLGAAETTNARRFLESLDRLESLSGAVNPDRLEDTLSRLYAEPSPVPAHTGYVELLTIHKAKGLEWDVVLVPALERKPPGTPARLLTWAVLDDMESSSATNMMLAPIAARGEEVDSLTRWLKYRHGERECAENKRLFYVACTRAREELHLFAAPALTSKGVSCGWPDTLLTAAWPAAEAHVILADATPVGSAPKRFGDMDECGPAAEGQEDDTSEGSDPRDLSQVTDMNLMPREHPILRRLPEAFDPGVRFAEAQSRRVVYGGQTDAAERPRFLRPEGSLGARAFGNVIHGCIELMTAAIAGGSTCDALLTGLATWSSRITALLRADGLPLSTVSRLGREARAALENLLRDPDGRWLLEPHAGGASELSLTAVTDAGVSTVRCDRVFLAGPEPHAPGSDYLWIVDYKTASASASAQTRFLAEQQATYGAQLAAYATVLAPARSVAWNRVRLALYFPALSGAPRLRWWKVDSAEAVAKTSRVRIVEG